MSTYTSAPKDTEFAKRLTDDVWHDIFVLASRDDSWYHSPSFQDHRVASPLLVSNIVTPWHIAGTSRHWRDIALNAPCMWSNIRVPSLESHQSGLQSWAGRAATLLTWLETSLARSANAPLVIDLSSTRRDDLRHGFQLEVVSLVVKHLHRVQVLVALVGDDAAGALASAPDYGMMVTCKVHRLAIPSIHSTSDCTPSGWPLGINFASSLLTKSVGLHDLQLQSSCMESIATLEPVLANLSRLSLQVDNELPVDPSNLVTLFRIIAESRIEQLSLHIDTPGPSGVTLPIPETTTIELPSLTLLCLAGRTVSILNRAFISLHAPNLSTLFISGPSPFLLPLRGSFPDLKTVELADLHLYDGEDAVTFCRSLGSAVSTVRFANCQFGSRLPQMLARRGDCVGRDEWTLWPQLREIRFGPRLDFLWQLEGHPIHDLVALRCLPPTEDAWRVEDVEKMVNRLVGSRQDDIVLRCR